ALFAVTIDHSVKRASIDAEDLGGTRAIAARDFEDVKQVASFEFVERRQIFEERGQRRASSCTHLRRLKFLRQIFGNNRMPARVQHRVLDCRLELAYISRPVVRDERSDGL